MVLYLYMKYIATITTKRQLTIPAKLFREASLKEGQKILITHDNGVLSFEPALDIIEKLAGSVSVPKRFKGMSSDKLIQATKKEYFKKRV